jgi:predicted TIM-barrel fold metal-dependent hydrolase
VTQAAPGSGPIIDCDIHMALDSRRIADFLPQPWRRRYDTGNRGSGVLGYWNPNGVSRRDTVLPNGERIEASPQTLAEHHFDAHGIAFGLLNMASFNFAVTPEADYGAALAAAVNDVLIEDWLPADPRFRASMVVTPVDPEAAVREIHRVGDHPGIVQVLLPSATQMPLGKRYYYPIYAAAVEHDLPVAIHPGYEGAGVSHQATAVGQPSSYLEWHTSLSGTHQAQLVSLVSEGVFQHFPTLRFVFLEGGISWLPPLLWRFDKNWVALRQTAPWLDRPPSEIVYDHVRFTTQPLEEPERIEHFRQMMAMFPAERVVMFSSDFPHWDGDVPDFTAGAFPPPMRQRVMAETARELYRLPRSAQSAPDVTPAPGAVTS